MTLSLRKLFSISRIFKVYLLNNEDERTRRVTLIRIVLATLLLGGMQTLIYILLGLPEATYVVLVYMLVTSVNLVTFYLGSSYNYFRNFQLLFILLLPALSQVAIGGFVPGSSVIFASLLSPMGAMLFHSIKVSRKLFFLYLLMLIGIGAWEYYEPDRRLFLTREVNLLFFTFNAITISIIIYYVVEYFLAQKLVFQKLLESNHLELREKNKILAFQQDKIQKINLDLININKDFTSSVNYAQRIQQAIFPDTEIINNHFQDSFVYFKPKDIVSGDFLWAAEKDDKIIIAAVDCTGHGVPGAFMSMIGTMLLNDIIIARNILDPGQILSELGKGIMNALRKKSGDNTDGMDLALLVYDSKNKILKYSGARNPLILIEDEQLKVIDGDKVFIGDEPNLFTTHTFEVKAGSSCYIYTDGYKDQFGGPNGKKFFTKNLHKILYNIHQLPFAEQERIMRETFENWKGKEPQTDDVLLIGLKL